MIKESVNDKYEINKNKASFTIQITNPMLYDKLHILAAEYSVSTEQLANVAIRRLVDDVDFVRSLRTGQIEMD